MDNFTLVYGMLHKGKKPSKLELKKMEKAYVDQLPIEVKNLLRAKKYNLIPGIDKFLRALSKEKDIILALGTGNVEKGAYIKLEPSGLGKYFTFGGWGTWGFLSGSAVKNLPTMWEPQ